MLEKGKEFFIELEGVKKDIHKSIDRLDDILDKVYYEFLYKDDGRNLTVARYMDDSCAHISGVGETVAFASVLDPKTQTLVVKDVYNNIISKAVFTINEDNEIMVNGIYIDEDSVQGKEKKIADKYLEAFKIFIDDYKERLGIEIRGVYVAENSPMLDNFEIYSKRWGYINVVDYSQYKVDRAYKGIVGLG